MIYGSGGVGSVYGSGAVAKIYGSGHGIGSHHGGLLDGERIYPEHELHQAVIDYKNLHGLHRPGIGRHTPHLPLDHTIRLMEHHFGENSKLRGGFIPPAVIGAALPFISQAASSLLGGFFNKGGEHLATAMSGFGGGLHPEMLHACGLPRRFRDHRGHAHWHIHGGALSDWLRTGWAWAKRMLSSDPVRKFGVNLSKTIINGLANALIGKVENKFGPKPAPAPAPAYQEAPIDDNTTASAPGPMASDQPPQDAAEPRGTGLRKRGRGMSKRAPPRKRGRRVTVLGHGLSIY